MKIAGTLVRLAIALSCLAALPPLATRASAQNFSDWSPPVNFGATVNSPSLDFGPAISKNGLSLCVSSTLPGGFGGEDI